MTNFPTVVTSSATGQFRKVGFLSVSGGPRAGRMLLHKCSQSSIELLLCHGRLGSLAGCESFNRVAFFNGFQCTYDGLHLGYQLCGEEEDVVGALNPVSSGVAQVFHDLLVELPLLLVAEVEEGKEEDRQEEGEEVKGGSQVEETTTTWMAMVRE